MVTIELPAGLTGNLVISDMTGKEVMKREVFGSESTIQVEIDDPGMYLFMLHSNQSKMYNKIVIH
jgi:hypothetical protein